MKKTITLLCVFFSVMMSIKATAQIEFESAEAYGQIFDVIYSETEADVMYGTTLTNHIVTSTDAGESWSILYSDPIDNYATLKDLRLINDGAALSFNVRAEGTYYNKIVLFDLATASVTQTFSPPNSFESDILIESYDISSTNNDVVLMHTTYSLLGAYTHEVFYTTDGGVNWFPIYYSPLNDSVAINNVSISPADDTILFLMRGGSTSRELGGLFVSYDAGQNWENKIPGNTYDAIAFNPDNADDILLGTSYGYDTHVENLYRSLDGGDTWAIVPITWTSMSTDHINKIVFNPNNTDEIIVLEENEIVLSTDNGATWENHVYTTIDPESYYYGLNASYNPFATDEILITTNFYPFLSTDGGVTMSRVENPFVNSTGTVTAFTSAEENHVYYGLRAGFIHKNLQNASEDAYSLQSLTQGFGSAVKTIADPVVPGRLFTGNRALNTSYINVSSEHGANQRSIASSMFFLILEDVSTAVTNTNISWMSTGIELHKLNLADLDNIVDEVISVPTPGEVVTAVQVDRESETTVFMSQGISFYKTTDDGVTWTLSNTGLEGLTVGSHVILDIEQNPLNANQLLLSTTQGIYLSEDKGASWEYISSEFTNKIAFSTLHENTIVAATYYSEGYNIPLPASKSKLIISTDLGETWSEITPEALHHAFTLTSDFVFTDDAVKVYFGVQDLGLMSYTIDLATLAIDTAIVTPNSPVSFYPNPAKNSFAVKTDHTLEAVTIYAISGQIVKQVKQPTTDINVSDLSAGVYLVKVKTTAGTVTKRFVKSN